MASSYTRENINYARLSRLLIECGTVVLSDVLQNQLTRQHPSKTLENILNTPLVKQSLSSVNTFNKQQQHLLYPTSRGRQNLGPGSRIVTTEDFDITLTCLLLRNICGLRLPYDSVWADPDPLDTSLEANITRIRDTRNTVYGHRTEVGISTADFTECWNDMVKMFLALSSRYTADDFDFLRHAPMDTELQVKYCKLLEIWNNREASVTEKILLHTEKTLQKVEQLPTARQCSQSFNKIKQLIELKAEELKSCMAVTAEKTSTEITTRLKDELKIESEKTRDLLSDYDRKHFQDLEALQTTVAENQGLHSERIQEQLHQLHEAVVDGQQVMDEKLQQVSRHQISACTTSNDEKQFGCQAVLSANRIPPRNSDFKGREQLLSEIRQALSCGLNTVTQRQVIYGFGGIGKTELVTEFAHLNKEFYDIIRWIDADTRTLLPAFREFAEDLGIDMREQNNNAMISQIFCKLKKIKTWLLIYDNAPDYNFIKEYLPKVESLSKMQHILVTSRSPKWQITIRLDVFTSLEAVEFIKSQCRSENEADCRQLAETLGCLPLALRQATQYIKQHRKTVPEYMQLYKGNQAKLLEWSFHFEDESEKTVMTTWITSEEQIREYSEDAKNLLYWCAFLSPNNIPVELFKHASLLSSEIRIDQAIDIAQSYSMVSSSSKDRCIRMHRLVQLVIRDNLLKRRDEGSIIQILHPLVKGVSDGCPMDLYTLNKFETARKYFPHINSLLLNIKNYIPVMSELVGDLMDTAMCAMINARESKDAVMIGEQLVKMKEEKYGADSINVAGIQHNTAIAMRQLGDARGAVSIYQHVIPINERHYGVDSVEVCQTQQNMAIAMNDLGDVREAVSIYQHVIPIFERHYGAESVQVCRTQENMATAKRQLGEVREAVSIYQHVIPIYERHYGVDSVQVCQTQENIANAMGVLGDVREAVSIYQHVIPIFERYYGVDSVQVCQTQENMATAMIQLGDVREAVSIYQHVIPIKERHYGVDSVEVCQTQQNMAIAMNDLGDVRGAVSIYQHVIPIYESHYGVDSVQVCRTQEHIANAMGDLGDVRGAVSIYQHVIPIKERHYGADSVQVCHTQGNMAIAMNDIGDHQTALDIYRRVIPVLSNYYGEEHVETANTYINMTYALNDIGDHETVIAILDRVSPIIQDQFGDNSTYMAEIHVSMAEALRKKGKLDDALTLFQKSVSMMKSLVGSNHVYCVARLLYKLSFCLSELGKVQDAKDLLDQAYKICVDNKCKTNYPIMERTIKRQQELHNTDEK